MKPCAKILKFKNKRFAAVDDVQEALFTLIEDEKAGDISSDEARQIQYQLADMIFTAAGERLKNELPDSPLTVRGRLRLSNTR